MESEQVKPSRIQFIRSFTGSIGSNPDDMSHRCYLDPTTNNINMEACRQTYSLNNNLPTNQWSVTPMYEQGTALQKLTWFVEFNTNEAADFDLSTPCMPATGVGCDAPGPDEIMLIEFTIAAL
jgi:hypothetical protein